MADVERRTQARKDGRLPNQIRPFAATPGALSRADGSARFSHDRTEVIASVYGPCEVRRNREVMGHATLEVLVRPRAGLPGPVEREVEQLLVSTLEHVVLTSLHPRTAISITVQIVQDDGSLLSVALHAVCVALLHAGVPLRGMLSGCTIALMAGELMVLDPIAEEEREAEAVVTVGFMFRQRYQYFEAHEDNASPNACAGATGEGGGEHVDEDEGVNSSGALPKMSVEHQLLLSHAHGVLSHKQYELCLHAAQQAGVCSSAFCRHAMERSTVCSAKLVGGASGSGGDAISALLDEAKRRAERDEEQIAEAE